MLIIGLLLVPRFYLLPNGGGTWFLFPLNLFFGVLLALMKPRPRSWFPIVGIAAVILVIANHDWFHRFGPVSALLCTAAVWSLAVYDRKLPAIFQPFRWMGQLSYGMYLLHLFCLSAVLRVITRLQQPHPDIFVILAIVLTTAVTVFASWLLQFCVEDPAPRLRPLLNRHPRMRYLLATVQVSLIPLGILLALLARTSRPH